MKGKPVNLVIVRHGETLFNARKLLQGSIDVELSEKGKHQAVLLAKSIAGQKFTRAFASDLSRAYETAKTILEHSIHKPTPEVSQDRRLRERGYGEREGKPVSEYLAEAKQSSTISYNPEGGEPAEDVLERVREFLKEICQLVDAGGNTGDGPEENILIVSHGGLLRVLMNLLYSTKEQYKLINFDTYAGLGTFGNTGYVQCKVYPYEEGGRDIVFADINNLSHLDASEQTYSFHTEALNLTNA